ncbi:hypothetical protein CI102_3027 [Trichoderma harzianum]|nr:hypothetical protein CI102_3027 [Trichoderma harzianum]
MLLHGQRAGIWCLLARLSLPCPCWCVKLWRVIASRNGEPDVDHLNLGYCPCRYERENKALLSPYLPFLLAAVGDWALPPLVSNHRAKSNH